MCPHKMDVEVKFDLSAVELVAQHRRVVVEQCVEALAHSCACADAYCRHPSCPKMKRVVIHTSICQRKNKGSCPICKQLIALCFYHAKNCRDWRCVVPFCNMVKQKLRRQRLLFERLRSARGLAPEDEPDEIDVNIFGGVSGWRMVRIVSSPLENADDEGQAAEPQLNGSEDDSSSGDANVEADNNNVGENNNDSSDASSDEGASTVTANSDDKPSNEAPDEQTESTPSD